MKEENNILNRCGNRRPFSVPEGYFEGLTDTIMAALPDKDAKKRTLIMVPLTHVRYFFYAAAMIAGVIFCLKWTNRLPVDKNNTQTAVANNVVYSDEYIDSFLEESMVDEYTIYCSLFDSYNY